MNKRILPIPHAADRSKLRFFAMAVDTALLCTALIVRTSALWQLCLFLLLLFFCRERLYNGFSMLGSLAPSGNTLLFLSTIAALLHGIASVTNRPFYVFVAFLHLLADRGEKLSARDTEKQATACPYPSKVYRYAVSAALLLAVGTFVLWLAVSGSVTSAAYFAASCMIAVGFAGMPAAEITEIAAVMVGKRAGVLPKNAHAVLQFGKVDTLTVQHDAVFVGAPALDDLYAVSTDRRELLAVAAAIERLASHPFSEAIVSAAEKLALSLPEVSEMREERGKGVRATVGTDLYFLGNRKLLRENGILLPEAIRKAVLGDRLPLYAAKNGSFCGMLLLAYPKKPEADFYLGKLREMGIVCNVCDREGVFRHEKGLQEQKNNVTIKQDLKAAYGALLLGRKARRAFLGNLCIAAVGFTICLVPATGILASPLGITLTPELAIGALLLTLVLTVLHALWACRIVLPEFTSSEEDDMLFGKVYYTMHIEGMSCAHCSARVKTALETLRGTTATMSLEEKVARIKCPMSIGVEELTKAVTDVGYTVLSCERV